MIESVKINKEDLCKRDYVFVGFRGFVEGRGVKDLEIGNI